MGRETCTFLPAKDISIWGAEVVATGAALYLAQQLGLAEPYYALAQSLAGIKAATDALKDLPKAFQNPEMLKPAAMGLGFITGVAQNLVLAADTLVHLNGKIRLHGNGKYVMAEDGVKEIDVQCVDGRIKAEEQERVEPGAGLNGGAFISNQAIAAGIYFGLPDNIATDFLTGYFMGKTVPTTLISAARTQITAFTTGLKGFAGQPPERENQLPHDKMCGWSGTQDLVKHWLKFSEGHHELKTQILDSWNRVDETIQTAIWEPLMNVLAVPLSGFRYRIAHNFGRTPISVSHPPHVSQ